MKKIMLVFVGILILCLSGCGGGSSANAPDVISLDGKSISYYDSSTKIPDEFWDEDVDFRVNSDNEIRLITIKSSDVETYNGISVGDSISKVESKYKYESKFDYIVNVAFKGNKEIKVGTQEATSEYICVSYVFDKSTKKITTIMISDGLYAKMAK